MTDAVVMLRNLVEHLIRRQRGHNLDTTAPRPAALVDIELEVAEWNARAMRKVRQMERERKYEGFDE